MLSEPRCTTWPRSPVSPWVNTVELITVEISWYCRELMAVERAGESAEYGLRHAVELAVDPMTGRLQLPVTVPEMGGIGQTVGSQNKKRP